MKICKRKGSRIRYHARHLGAGKKGKKNALKAAALIAAAAAIAAGAHGATSRRRNLTTPSPLPLLESYQDPTPTDVFASPDGKKVQVQPKTKTRGKRKENKSELENLVIANSAVKYKRKDPELYAFGKRRASIW